MCKYVNGVDWNLLIRRGGANGIGCVDVRI